MAYLMSNFLTFPLKLTYPKVSLLRAADHWRTVAIPNKGIPNIKTSDGPNGARGAVFKAGTKVRK